MGVDASATRDSPSYQGLIQVQVAELKSGPRPGGCGLRRGPRV